MTNTQIQNYCLSRGQEAIVYSLGILEPLMLGHHTQDFLSVVGLPTEAAPFLSFSTNTHGEWNSISRVTKIDTAFNSSFANLIQIGSDGSGNPIVIDTHENDFIKLLDHDNGFALKFINSLIGIFATSLVAYATFIDNVIAQGGENAFFDTHFTDTQLVALKNTLTSTDKYFDKSEFLQGETVMLLGNREAHGNESGD
ncbi:MAG: hypothetical protein ACRYFX_20515 [Janthinobacterium lividum]